MKFAVLLLSEIVTVAPGGVKLHGSGDFFKPLSWRVGDLSYARAHWAVKNLFELKNAKTRARPRSGWRALTSGSSSVDRCWRAG